jgi:hypothetical protein
MKIIFSVIGLAIAWGAYRHAPSVFAVVTGLNGFNTAVGTIAGLLTAVWGVNLARLSIFEKLDDLTGDQKELAILKAGNLRRQIIFSMFTNTLLLVAVIVAVNLLGVPELKAGISSWIGYLVTASVAYWIAGFIESWYCWIAIDQSRLSMAAAQTTNKQRIKYLDKMRDDEAKVPVSRSDAHLKGYTEDCKPC